MTIPGASMRINAFKLVAVTGDRFLNAFDDVAVHPDSPPAKRAREGAAKGRASGFKPGANMAVPKPTVSKEEAAAADALVAILEGSAPACLSTCQLDALVRVAQLHMADAVVAALPAYIKPLFADDAGLRLDEVRDGGYLVDCVCTSAAYVPCNRPL